jgi:hypothetical protein
MTMRKMATGTMVLLMTLAAMPAWAADTFIKSDDYKDGEEVVGKFLNDDDYRLMVEDIERNKQEFDWGWVRAEGKADKPKKLGFDVRAIKTVSIPTPSNHAGLIAASLIEPVAENAKLFAQQMGWTVVAAGQAADAELGIAIVDAKADRTFAVVATIDPFIELEVRLTAAGQTVLLVRNQAHSNSPADASLKFMDELSKFLQ